MALREDLLEPIAGDNPGGADLRYQPVYDQIKEARREEDAASQGVWQRERKVADWKLVAKLAGDALAKKSKDLQLAAWLTEALAQREGFSGFRDGLELMRALLERFWDHLFPELEDGDSEMRAVPLVFVSTRLAASIQTLPLTPFGISLLEYKDSASVPAEEDAVDERRRQLRAAALEDGKTTPEILADALKQTPSAHFEELAEEIRSCLEELPQLDELCNDKFGEYAPSFSSLKDTLEELSNTCRILVQRKGGLSGKPAAPAARPAAPSYSSSSDPFGGSSSSDPFGSSASSSSDPFGGAPAAPEPAPAAEAFAAAPAADPFGGAAETPAEPAADPFGGAAAADLFSSGSTASSYQEPARASYGGTLSAEPHDREDAAARLASIARWLRNDEPASPAPYLLLRGFRWGQLRGAGAEPEWFLLEAPPTETRQLLKRLAQEQQWAELLEAAEDAMALPCGRAWLDIQRYTLTALRYLGETHVAIDAAVRNALRAFLADYPALLQRSLNDDTACANSETVDLFRREGLLAGGPAAPAPAAVAPSAQSDEEIIAEAVRMRRYEQALQFVSARLALESSGRGRFQRKSQLASILVASGRQAVAFPILRELCAEIEARHLDQWETPALITDPLILLHRCLAQDSSAEEERSRIYTLVCRLDPLRAFELG